MSAPQKRLRPTTYSHRQALARMRKQQGLVMCNTSIPELMYRYWEGVLEVVHSAHPGGWHTPITKMLPSEKAARWFDAIPQPK